MIALGPLRLTHEDLWRLTWGEVDDLIYAWKYSEYLESQKRAQHAAWIINACGRLKHPVSANDLAGYWVDGQIMSKGEYHEHLKKRVKARRGDKSGEEKD